MFLKTQDPDRKDAIAKNLSSRMLLGKVKVASLYQIEPALVARAVELTEQASFANQKEAVLGVPNQSEQVLDDPLIALKARMGLIAVPERGDPDPLIDSVIQLYQETNRPTHYGHYNKSQAVKTLAALLRGLKQEERILLIPPEEDYLLLQQGVGRVEFIGQLSTISINYNDTVYFSVRKDSSNYVLAMVGREEKILLKDNSIRTIGYAGCLESGHLPSFAFFLCRKGENFWIAANIPLKITVI
ncbi:hypothetical protein A2232_03545 [candidate division WOR-1 bacterium RIFOXYA2_FULL_46_56]|uniref:Uncharacterized protein n=1 Tax=candidate division WOR-1 bacterium RIFOXYC2_FULL_46_14 TaxID=1802587 RepID=A0A1F4U495_UNCSA|nr:MAG: hypothetical protein A2232_03545 [candidate division WOR-1 bacterium RIFOXYA2_FULL_46_56]OGC39699.1 MAG: hypothetical protein A2438_06935 [candidate division WOR-1 bacterium RIFOXYC2_FULL_46_14]